ncbi:MAG: hypothetical protein U9R36_04225, partial [Elusimicrobiota bacterium]|nr:hypothetical protein [Elusimicrobiota bacterium]
NTGDSYTNPAFGYDPKVIESYRHVCSTLSWAQSFSNEKAMNLTGIAVQVWNKNSDNALTVNIQSSTYSGSYLVPDGLALATATVKAQQHPSNPSWQSWQWTDFIFDSMIKLEAGATYWIVAKNTATLDNGYGWLDASGNYSGVQAWTDDGGSSWSTSTAKDLFFKIYQATGTKVSFYNGDPDSGGTYIGGELLGPVDRGTYQTASTEWAAPNPDWYNIYAVVNFGGSIIEAPGKNPAQKASALTVFYNNNTQNTISAGNVEIVVEPGTIKENYFINIEPDPADSIESLIEAANVKLNSNGDPFSFSLPGRTARITAYNSQGELFSGSFEKKVKVIFSYSDLNPSGGYLEGTTPEVKAETLRVNRLDEKHSLWVRMPEYEINKDNNTVTAMVESFSVFSLSGSGTASLDEAYAFPVPYIPFEHDEITFTSLSPVCDIKIYILSGELVKTIKHEGGPQAVWDDIDAGSGTYLYTIENETEFKKGKLMIIR